MESALFTALPVETPNAGARPARVCIATYEISGPSRNSGGIGTAYFSLAVALASAGHEVTVLYLSAEDADEAANQDWTDWFRNRGVGFVPLPRPPQKVDAPECMLISRDAYNWLKERAFDIIHFPDLQGHGYYSVLAKHQGLDFDATTLCIGTHSPISWIREANREAPHSPDELEMEFMECQCVALADVVVSPSQYMLRWMLANGWELPAKSYVQQNVVAPESRLVSDRGTRPKKIHPIRELVFFGRLEERKGIGLFCDALDLLAATDLPEFTVTFLGGNATVSGRDSLSYIQSRSARWPFAYRALTDRDRQTALRFLLESADRVAIIPSLNDNLPYTVLECLVEGIPFLASCTGGIPELLPEPEADQLTFAPNPTELAGALGRALRQGVPVAGPAIDPDENRLRWVDWHASAPSRSVRDKPPRSKSATTPEMPLVSVCVSYRGHHDLFLQSAESLRRQSWPKFELILLDCSKEGVELDGLGKALLQDGWQIIRQAESGVNVPRGVSIAHARGDYVLFLDATDYASPDAIATFVAVASRTGADVLTCFLSLFTGNQAPNHETLFGHYPFLGNAALLGLFRNHFGSRCIFARKETLSSIASACPKMPVDCGDWEFLARVAIAGLRLEVVPRPLVWYRLPDGADLSLRAEYYDHLRAVTPYAEAMPGLLRDLPRAAVTMKLHYERQYGLSHSHEAILASLQRQLVAGGHAKVASILNAWFDYSSSRSNLPERRLQRLSIVARHLLRGHYHRFAHGFGSALRDLRKPANAEAQPLVQKRAERDR